jgi:hypothetical protein
MKLAGNFVHKMPNEKDKSKERVVTEAEYHQLTRLDLKTMALVQSLE